MSEALGMSREDLTPFNAWSIPSIPCARLLKVLLKGACFRWWKR